MPMKKITLVGFDHLSDAVHENMKAQLVEATKEKVPVSILKKGEKYQSFLKNQDDQSQDQD